jgi:hypothetical protein
MTETATIPAQLISDEARLLHGLTHEPAVRNEELAAELARLNRAVREAADELGFDDQPGDFLVLLASLREPDE